MQTFLLALLLLFTESWPSSAWTTPQTYSYDPASSQTQHSYNSYSSQPDSSYQHPYAFDFSHLFSEQATVAATASAYATNAAQFAQQFAHQLASAPPVNAQVDQQNIEKYSQYLDILQNAYGIQLPGELGQNQETLQQYQLSAYPTATATSYQAGASPYITTSQPEQTVAAVKSATLAPGYSLTSQPQTQYQVYQPRQTVYGSQQQLNFQTAVQPSHSTSSVYPVVYPDSQSYSQMQQQTQQSQITSQVSSTSVPSAPLPKQQAQQLSGSSQAFNNLYTSPTAHPAPQAYSFGNMPAQTTYTFPQTASQKQYPQQSVQYPPIPSSYPQQQSLAALPQQQYASLPPPQMQQPQQPHSQFPAYPSQEVRSQPASPQMQAQQPAYPQQAVPPQPSAQPEMQVHHQSQIRIGDMYPQQAERPTPAYQTAAFSTYNGQPPPPKPQVYTYPGPGQFVKPSYSTNVATHNVGPIDQSGVRENSVEEPEMVGSVYGAPNPSEPAVYIPHVQSQPTHPPSLPPNPLPATHPTTQLPVTTRPRPTAPTTPPPTRPSSTTKNPEMAVSVQALTKQIRRLPAVLYLDSRRDGSAELETLLRETYGLPLVAFYVDKVGRPQLAQKNLYQLTAHKGLPYLFICGTFIGSEQHIQNYHKNGQIPQLVEYVCGDEKKKSKTNKMKKTTS